MHYGSKEISRIMLKLPNGVLFFFFKLPVINGRKKDDLAFKQLTVHVRKVAIVYFIDHCYNFPVYFKGAEKGITLRFE